MTQQVDGEQTFEEMERTAGSARTLDEGESLFSDGGDE